MHSFEALNLSKALQNAINDLGFERPTPIQVSAYPIIRSGKDIVGIAQTGTGKTLAYLLPILQDLKFSDQVKPRVLILVPTRELVLQVVEQVKSIAQYMTTRVLGVYGGTNINTQKIAVDYGCDVLVATPRRLYDLVLNSALSLKDVKKLVIDEVDVMLDLGFVYQLTNIFELLPDRRQNIMFSATMTDEVDILIDAFFANPVKVSVALSGTPLDNIAQQSYPVKNFYTKVNLLIHLLADKDTFGKVLVFISHKKSADRAFEHLKEAFMSECSIIHANKSQNYRIRSVKHFDQGISRILVATDVIARGLDLDKITHVINFDTPKFPENYMHRIGRTGRAEQQGKAILLYTPKEEEAKLAIETLMNYSIPVEEFPEEVMISHELAPEERPENHIKNKFLKTETTSGGAFHEKKDKNKKVNLGGSYRRELAQKYKKPKTRGDKKRNLRKQKKK